MSTRATFQSRHQPEREKFLLLTKKWMHYQESKAHFWTTFLRCDFLLQIIIPQKLVTFRDVTKQYRQFEVLRAAVFTCVELCQRVEQLRPAHVISITVKFCVINLTPEEKKHLLNYSTTRTSRRKGRKVTGLEGEKQKLFSYTLFLWWVQKPFYLCKVIYRPWQTACFWGNPLQQNCDSVCMKPRFSCSALQQITITLRSVWITFYLLNSTSRVKDLTKVTWSGEPVAEPALGWTEQQQWWEAGWQCFHRWGHTGTAMWLLSNWKHMCKCY